MNNKDYQKNSWACYGVMLIGLLAVIGFSVADIWIGIAMSTALVIFACIMFYMANEDYSLYKSFYRRFHNKTIREKLIGIIQRPEVETVYMHYGTPEEFNEFKEYIESLNISDELWEDFDEFLEKAKKHNRLK